MIKRCARLLGLLAALVLSVALWWRVWLVISPAFGQESASTKCVAPGQLGCMTEIGIQPSASDITTEEDLRLAAVICENNLYQSQSKDNIFVPGYSDPACDTVVKRWNTSKWKHAQDADQKREKDAEIVREKAFVEAVARQKKGVGEK